MRVFISVDMEGIAGIVHAEQTRPHAPEYERSCRLMTAEANAAIEGALAAGAREIVVSDSHWDMRNIIADELNPAAELIQGSPRPWSMMQGIDERFDAVCFVGYHAMAGTEAAVIDHTYTGSILNVRLNDQPVGEIGINAALAGHFGVPVRLVTGDQQAVAEAHALLGADLVTVAVKQSVARFAARSVAPVVARERIREAMTQALRQRREPWRVTGSIKLSVDFMKTQQADMAALLPGAERTAPRTVEFAHDDYLTVFRAWRVLFTLGQLD
ncbi:MAG TPA: M55 family metallopeptidase [Herpetosiphonaceae bacterium]